MKSNREGTIDSMGSEGTKSIKKSIQPTAQNNGAGPQVNQQDPLLFDGVWWYFLIGWDAKNGSVLETPSKDWSVPAEWKQWLSTPSKEISKKMLRFNSDWVTDEALGGAEARGSIHEDAMRCILYISKNTAIDDPVRELAGRYSKAIQERFDRIVNLTNKGFLKAALVNRKRNLVSSYGDQIRKLTKCLGDLSGLVAPEIFAQEDEKPVLDAELDATLGTHAEMMEKMDGAFQVRDMALGIGFEEEMFPTIPQQAPLQPVPPQQPMLQQSVQQLEAKLAEADKEMSGIAYGIGRVIGFLISNLGSIIGFLLLGMAVVCEVVDAVG